MNVAYKKKNNNKKLRTEHKYLIQFDSVIKFMLFHFDLWKSHTFSKWLAMLSNWATEKKDRVRNVLFLELFWLLIAHTTYSQLSKYHLWKLNNEKDSDILLNGLMSLIYIYILHVKTDFARCFFSLSFFHMCLHVFNKLLCFLLIERK